MEDLSKRENPFLKLEEGDNKVRVVSGVHVLIEHRTNLGGKLRFTVCPTEMDRLNNQFSDEKVEVRPCPLCEKGYPVQTKYVAIVISRKDGKPYILKGSKAVLGYIKGLEEDPDWGNYREFDVNIKGTGKGTERRYQPSAIPRKEETAKLTPEEEELLVSFGMDKLEKMTQPNEYATIVKKLTGSEEGTIPEFNEEDEIPF